MYDIQLLRTIHNCPYTGLERQLQNPLQKCVKVFESIFTVPKTYRFLFQTPEKITVAGLLITQESVNIYRVSGVYTLPDYRGQGFARSLLAVARQRLGDVRHSDCLTEAGKLFARVA